MEKGTSTAADIHQYHAFIYNQIPKLTLRHSIGTGILVTNPEVFHLSVSTSDQINQARTVIISRNQRTLSPVTQVFSTRE